VAPREPALERIRLIILLALLLIALIVTACAAPGRQSASASFGDPREVDQNIMAELTHIARAKIEAEHYVLITGDTSGLDPTALSLTEEAATEIDEIAQTQIRVHDGLAQCGVGHTAARTTITVDKAEIGVDHATMAAVVFNELTYASRVVMSEAPKHVFHFARVTEQWLLTRDEKERFPLAAPPTHWWDQLFRPPRVPEAAQALAPVCPRPSGASLEP